MKKLQSSKVSLICLLHSIEIKHSVALLIFLTDDIFYFLY